MYNILLFPDRGFLIDSDILDHKDFATDEEREMWEHREIQMEILRKLCIPEIVLLLHKVLHLAGEYGMCINIIDQLASEKNQLYLCFTKQKLSEIILKISESSLALMNEKLDPWGYTITA